MRSRQPRVSRSSVTSAADERARATSSHHGRPAGGDDAGALGHAGVLHHAAGHGLTVPARDLDRDPDEPDRRRRAQPDRDGELLQRGGEPAVHPGGQPRAAGLVRLARAPRRRGAPGRPGRPGRRAPARRRRRPGAAAGRRSARAARRCPAPVRADTHTAPGRARRRVRMSSSVIASTLLTTMSSGTARASISPSTTRTASIWPSGSGSEPSTTCSSRSAAATSSSVERKASTSWCGRCRTNPTVSVSVYSRPSGDCGPADGRVEGGEQRVLHQHAGAGQRVEQAGLAGVGVAGDRHARARRCGHGWTAGWPARWPCRRSPGGACSPASGCAAGRSRSWSHRDHGYRCRHRRRRGHRPAGTSTHPSRAGAAACTASGRARPGPCPPGWSRAGRRCPGSARSGRRP